MHYYRMSDILFSGRVMKYPYSAAYYLKINNKYFPLPLNMIRFEILWCQLYNNYYIFLFLKKRERITIYYWTIIPIGVRA